jgi:hypothetical protein
MRGHPSGLATTFTTTLDKPQLPQSRSNQQGKKREGKKKEGGKQDKKSGEMKQIKCFANGEIGNYANKCPTRQTKDKDMEEPQNIPMLLGMQVHLLQQLTMFMLVVALGTSSKQQNCCLTISQILV